MKYIKLSVQLALLGKLLAKKLISETEYECLVKQTKKDYGIL